MASPGLQPKDILPFILRHKLKLGVAFLSFWIFCFLLFPFQDTGDLVGAEVARLTNNQVFVQFDRLNVGLLPLSVGAQNISVETPMIPAAINADLIEVSPSLGALITQKPNGTLVAKGLFRGDVEIGIKPGRRTDAGAETYALELKAESLNLNEVQKVAQLPILLKGRLNVTSGGTVDPTFQQQPDVDVELKVNSLEIPPSTINTMMGPLNLPDLRLSSVDLKGRLAGGRFNIERGEIGRTGDELFGSIRGNVSVVMQNRGRVVPIIGAYNLEIDLTATPQFQNKASLFLSFLDAYKSNAPNGARYQFKVNATSPELPPNIGAVR